MHESTLQIKLVLSNSSGVKYELTSSVTLIILHHCCVIVFKNPWNCNGKFIMRMVMSLYNSTSPEDSEHYRTLTWLPWSAKPFICLFLSSLLFSLFLSVSVFHSAHSSPQWREAHCEAAWRWQRTWEPFQAPLSESDKGPLIWQLGKTPEPCTSLCCAVLAVDPVLKPPPDPALLGTRHPYHIHTHS